MFFCILRRYNELQSKAITTADSNIFPYFLKIMFSFQRQHPYIFSFSQEGVLAFFYVTSPKISPILWKGRLLVPEKSLYHRQGKMRNSYPNRNQKAVVASHSLLASNFNREYSFFQLTPPCRKNLLPQKPQELSDLISSCSKQLDSQN